MVHDWWELPEINWRLKISAFRGRSHERRTPHDSTDSGAFLMLGQDSGHSATRAERQRSLLANRVGFLHMIAGN